MSIDGSHLVLVSLNDSLEHVLNVRADGSDGSQLLLLPEPFLHLDGISVHLVDVDGQVLEGLGEATSGPLHSHLHTLGDLDKLKGVNFLHGDFSCRSESSNI